MKTLMNIGTVKLVLATSLCALIGTRSAESNIRSLRYSCKLSYKLERQGHLVDTKEIVSGNLKVGDSINLASNFLRLDPVDPKSNAAGSRTQISVFSLALDLHRGGSSGFDPGRDDEITQPDSMAIGSSYFVNGLANVTLSRGGYSVSGECEER
ncbi:MAG: hypothetical protein N2578_06735 [Bdellovibrionaceae bacterium]|nr:hypothetical protein [Pseudobdellovibrionaceae bacterium]